MLNRRHCLTYIGTSAVAGLSPSLAFAQGKPLKILVGYPAGGAVDVVARQVGEELRAAGYNAIVENRTGAAGQLATEAMLAAPADGSTIVMMPGGNATIFPHVYPKLRYSMSDLAPLAGVCSFQFALGVDKSLLVEKQHVLVTHCNHVIVKYTLINHIGVLLHIHHMLCT